jgi:hypothetical protein
MRNLHTAVIVTLICGSAIGTQAQVLNRLKQKVSEKTEQKANEILNGKNKKPSGTGNSGNTGNNGSSNGSPHNTSGGGLISTPPDVNQNLTDAEAAYKNGSFGESRYAIQQAMLGVELEIGNKILKSLPASITGLNTVAESDQVTSTGWGWAGLTIQRVYRNTADKQLTVTIANNSMWMSAVSAYLASGGYAQQNNGQQNWKQIKIKGNRAIIEYSESSGYKISVPIGQSSLIVYEGLNFANEPEITKAAETLNIDAIKKELGEQ